ncbi:amino acid ABC transporter permease [Paenibacillus radicis (ex Xue et al. 2023)]|uniref:Amino acid ABC transporter permease n=1 Tax=Paenibacillus radicis (ex Xue et al. 2023) TaxID=2972489 RepID=A0ABT1YU91_9BACL|nr:amino acid ABC transporter permease [Paenibacillus radicis (ex Xue et al. 2023)]MCR8635878.1 amino acid ABC transporter permease [Paenibacillus radicis (ex Xue et al. 2023)]
MDTTLNLILRIAERLPVTLTILLLSLLFGLLLGLVIAIVRIQKKAIPYAIATFYLSFMRCTPTIVQLFLIYYGLPQLLILFGIDVNNWDKIIFAVITFSLHSAAFFSEVIRSSYLAVGSGQQEAAYSVGMSYSQSLRRIILPQAFGIAIPSLGNNVIILLKETSLAFSIGITDIMGQVQIILGNNYGANTFQVYFLVSLIYWGLSIVIEKGLGRLEKIYKKGHVSIAR